MGDSVQAAAQNENAKMVYMTGGFFTVGSLLVGGVVGWTASQKS
jgi:hypothetical protein